MFVYMWLSEVQRKPHFFLHRSEFFQLFCYLSKIWS